MKKDEMKKKEENYVQNSKNLRRFQIRLFEKIKVCRFKLESYHI